MDKYEKLGKIGEGSYGVVIKARIKASGRIVAIKRFMEAEDDPQIGKIAKREVRMLKGVRHHNIVNLLEVFRRKHKLHLVFEYLEGTLLDELDRSPKGLKSDNIKRISYQIIRAVEFCHQNRIVHRDVKPENILISTKEQQLIVKLCDFGFARTVATKAGEAYTDYVATRWYRAPELLVGDTQYGTPVDIWAIGCAVAEMMTGRPIYPGKSDIDQIYLIVRNLGPLIQRHVSIFKSNSYFKGLHIPDKGPSTFDTLQGRYAGKGDGPDDEKERRLEFLKKSVALDPDDRPSATEMLDDPWFSAPNSGSEAWNKRFEREFNVLTQSWASPGQNGRRRPKGKHTSQSSTDRTSLPLIAATSPEPKEAQRQTQSQTFQLPTI